MNDLKAKRNYLRDENKKWAHELRELDREDFPPIAQLYPDKAPRRIWRSREFLVQLFVDRPSGMNRLSVNRTEIFGDGKWKDGITWDDLQRLKREAGFGAMQAIEFYPPDEDIVYDANIRHLWLMDQPLSFAWTKLNSAANRK